MKLTRLSDKSWAFGGWEEYKKVSISFTFLSRNGLQRFTWWLTDVRDSCQLVAKETFKNMSKSISPAHCFEVLWWGHLTSTAAVKRGQTLPEQRRTVGGGGGEDRFADIQSYKCGHSPQSKGRMTVKLLEAAPWSLLPQSHTQQTTNPNYTFCEQSWRPP